MTRALPVLVVALALAACAGPVDGGLPGEAWPVDGRAGPPLAPTLTLRTDGLVRGGTVGVVIRGLDPGQDVNLAGGARAGSGPCFSGVCVGIRSPTRVGTATADADGVARIALDLPSGLGLDAVVLRAVAFGPGAVSAVEALEVVDPGEDAAALRAGVGTLPWGGAYPSRLVAYADGASLLGVDASGTPIAASARAHRGKVLAVAHSTVLGGAASGRADDARLVQNALDWMGADPGEIVGVAPGEGALEAWLDGQGYDARQLSPTSLGPAVAYLAPAWTAWSDAQVDALRDWTEDGGGLILAGQAWYWSYSNADVPNRYPANRVVGDHGVLWTSSYGVPGTHDVSSAPDPLRHAGTAAAALFDHVAGGPTLSPADLDVAADAAGFAIAQLDPARAPGLYDRLGTVDDVVGPIVPTRASPVSTADPLTVLAARYETAVALRSPPDALTAHPAAAVFPGAVDPGAPRVTRSRTIDGDHAGMDGRFLYAGTSSPVWRSTGLYAAPGEAITVTIPAWAVGAGLSVQIGAHTDTLWAKSSLERFPQIVRREPLDAEVTEVGSGFGGLVYVTVDGGTSLGSVPVTFEGVVEAASYRLGDDVAAWQAALPSRTAPWAELASEDFVLTVPRSSVAALSDPASLTAFWQDVLDESADLAAISRDRVRAERFVLDDQISVGYMHSGYPLMGPTSVASEMTDLARLQAQGTWGPFHEIGHNHQWRDWLLPGTTEASCNLWSVYVTEQLTGIDRDTAHPALDPADRAQRIADYVAGGRDFADWSVWTALETHLQLQEAFGWAFYEDLFALYQADAPGSGPSDDQGRIDLFVARAGQVTGLDLGPFFVAWGLPVGQPVLDDLGLLPGWVGDPMNP